MFTLGIKGTYSWFENRLHVCIIYGSQTGVLGKVISLVLAFGVGRFIYMFCNADIIYSDVIYTLNVYLCEKIQ